VDPHAEVWEGGVKNPFLSLLGSYTFSEYFFCIIRNSEPNPERNKIAALGIGII